MDRYYYDMARFFVVDFEEYKQLASNISPADNEFVLPLRQFNSLPANIPNTLYPEDKTSSFDRYLVIKFRLDESKKTARFRIYVLRSSKDKRFLYLDGISNRVNEGQIVEMEEEDILKIIRNEDVFEHFYFECDLNAFLKFIQAPLKY